MMRSAHAGLLLMLSLLVGVAVAEAAPGDLLLTIPNPAPADQDEFGYSVAAVGGKIAVGAFLDGPANDGAVYVFDGTNGALLLTIPNPTLGDFDDLFGWAVAALGGNILVGARGDDRQAGTVYLFDGTTGARLLTIPNPEPDATRRVHFGESVAAVGGKILVGAPWNSPGGVRRAGAVYLFDGASGALLVTIPNPAPAADDEFGYSVAAVGGNLLVGARQADPGGVTDAGIAYLFDGTTGALLLTIPNPVPVVQDWFGWSVAGVGGNILVGAPGVGGVQAVGAAYLFDGTTGALLLTIPNPTAPPGQFGWSVAALGSNLLVGSPSARPGGVIGAGEVHVFDGTTGALLLTVPNPAPGVTDFFGWSVAAAGENILVGVPFDDPGGSFDVGSVYLVAGVEVIDIRGSVDVGGAPAVGNPVILRNRNTGTRTETSTDVSGTYKFDPVAAGPYKITVKALAAAGPTTVSGSLRVKGVPAADTRVKLKNAITGAVRRTTTDAGGNFSFGGVEAGTYKLMIPRLTVP